MLAVNREVDINGQMTKKLTLLADRTVNEGLGGNMAAVKEIADRLDGKAPQPLTGDKDNPIEVVGRIERIIVRPQNTNG